MRFRDNSVNKLNDQFQEICDSTSNCSIRKNIEWSYENEEILAEWCDIAQCYKWLNTETYKYYKNITSWMTIPCIICSTICGTASFGLPNIPVQHQPILPLLIGSVTIGVGIVTTIQQYYRFSELKETHRILAVAWDKLARSIHIELAKAPLERIDARHFIKFTRIEFDRLMENSEIIPNSIICKFNQNTNKYRDKLEKMDNDDIEANRKNFKKALKKPDICDIVISINEKRRIWFPQPQTIQLDDETRIFYPKNKRRKRTISNIENKYNEKDYNDTEIRVVMPVTPNSNTISSSSDDDEYNILNYNNINNNNNNNNNINENKKENITEFYNMAL